MTSLVLENLFFSYGPNSFHFNCPKLEISTGESLAIVGSSGCGKSTLLQVIAGLLKPQKGQISIGETPLHSLNESERRSFRLNHLGFIYQGFELLEYLTVRDNILLPLRMMDKKIKSSELQQEFQEQVETCGLKDKLQDYPKTLSHGERQRVAVCRTALQRPQFILADEPTGSLDHENRDRVIHLLLHKVKAHPIGLIMVTHDRELLPHFDRVIEATSILQP